MSPVLSTYRLQLRPPDPDSGHPGCTFDDAAALAPYLADLGVTHLYCSPYLQASAGSGHGYDVVDPTRLNAELGGPEAHARLQQACRDAGLGMVLDVVPNHVSVSEPESANAAWWGLLREGRQGPYARWFDVAWDAPENPGKVLVPVLGSPLGECLQRGELTVERDAELGPVVRYYDHVFPVAPGTEHLSDDLPALLAAQHYRLSDWHVAGEDLNYRRFFDVTTLAGVRVEDPEVFEATHALVVQQVRDGVLDGLRIDHPDGLADPEGYLERLQESTGGTWVVVEKILEAAEGEELPASWPCAGTTGYDALNRLVGILVDPAGEQPLTTLYGARTGEETSYAAVVDDAKALVLSDVLSAEVGRLTDLVRAVTAADLVLRDSTRRALRQALVALLAAFPVYRAYVRPGRPVDEHARHLVAEAAAVARARAPHVEREVDAVASLALGDPLPSPDPTAGDVTALRDELVVRFQQTCGPVMAKGVEDTAFYRYLRLTALNEVGGDPGRFGTSVAEWHAACAAAQRQWPHGMTTLSTHDTKRSEDVRARLAVLAEVPALWADACARWSAAAERHRSPAGPSRLDEYLLWQTLAGAWPLPADRAVAYVEKASREAKLSTSWTAPDPAYDEALAAFVRAVLADEALTSDVAAFVDEVLAAPGRSNALAQKLLQLTAPGVPDVYQGTEVEDLSLVDPDNRRPVDWQARRDLVARVGTAAPEELGRDLAGLAKTAVVAQALRLRRERPDLLGPEADYAALVAEGPAAEHLVASARGGDAVTLATRLPVGLRTGPDGGGWRGTTVQLPTAGAWTDRLTGRSHTVGADRTLDVGSTLADLPVALLVRD